MIAVRSLGPFVAALTALLNPLGARAITLNPETAGWLIKTWESEDGLPENSATAMVQTSDGYLWFGTFKGLVRFDGVRFTVFDRANTPELPSDGIVNLHLDRGGRLWISTLAGLAVREGTKWRSFHEPEKIPPDDYIRTFTERRNGELLLTTFSGRILEFANGDLSQLPAPSKLQRGYLGGVDEEGNWWVAQSEFVGRWRSDHWEATVPAKDLATTTASRIGFGAARDGGFWLLLNTELRKYSHGTEVSRRQLPELPGLFWSLTEDTGGNIWICTTDKGICQVLPGNEFLTWNEKNGLSYHGVRFVFEDRERNRWMGTSGGGLQRFKARRFTSFGPESGLTERVVKSVWPAPDGGLWVVTYGQGLFRWTEAGVTNVLQGATNQAFYGQTVLTDRKGQTWIGTYGPGLFLLDDQGKRQLPVAQSGGNNVIALFEDSRGRIWISGGQGVSMFQEGVFRPYQREAGPIVGVCCFGENSDGNVWLSNRERVFRLENDHFVEVQDGSGNPIGGITCLKGDRDGSMWMGSVGAGLLRWRQGVLAAIGVPAGLPVPNVHAILEDDQGFFWMPSNRGIMRAAQTDLQSIADGLRTKIVAQLFNANDGLVGVECPSGQQPVCARDSQGRLWFATAKGLAMTDPARFGFNTVAPQAVIEEVSYRLTGHGTADDKRAIRRIGAPFQEPLQLPAGSRGIEIRYTAPSFTSPEKVAFQLTLDGAAMDWEEVGNRRVAYFDELEAGRHVFQVRAANDDGLWSQAGASLTLTVLPFFWETGLFRGSIVASICALALAWAYRLRAGVKRRQAAQEAFTRQLILSQENERKRVASELHDGLGQDLLLIKNRLGLVMASVAPEVARQLLEISSIASRTIGDVRSMSHALRPSALEQVGLTKAIEWMIEQNAEASKTKFSSELENIDDLLTPEMEINLYRIAQEALNNVLKHARASEVIVELARKPEGISLSVFDDGKGFDPEQGAQNGERQLGFGLASLAERAKVLGGRFEIRSSPGTGTRLTVYAPLPKRRKVR